MAISVSRPQALCQPGGLNRPQRVEGLCGLPGLVQGLTPGPLCGSFGLLQTLAQVAGLGLDSLPALLRRLGTPLGPRQLLGQRRNSGL